MRVARGSRSSRRLQPNRLRPRPAKVTATGRRDIVTRARQSTMYDAKSDLSSFGCRRRWSAARLPRRALLHAPLTERLLGLGLLLLRRDDPALHERRVLVAVAALPTLGRHEDAGRARPRARLDDGRDAVERAQRVAHHPPAPARLDVDGRALAREDAPPPVDGEDIRDGNACARHASAVRRRGRGRCGGRYRRCPRRRRRVPIHAHELRRRRRRRR